MFYFHTYTKDCNAFKASGKIGITKLTIFKKKGATCEDTSLSPNKVPIQA